MSVQWGWEFKHLREKQGFVTRSLMLWSDSHKPSVLGLWEGGQHVMQRPHKLRDGQLGPRLCLAYS